MSVRNLPWMFVGSDLQTQSCNSFSLHTKTKKNKKRSVTILDETCSEDRAFSHRTNVITQITACKYSVYNSVYNGMTVIPHNTVQTMPGK